MVKNPGMTLREYYAGQALAGMLGNSTVMKGDHRKIAKESIAYADALIAELEGGGHE